MYLSIIIFILCCFVGCGNPPFTGSDVVGADEFVIDSYKIRQGKFSILELEGKDYEELSEEFLNEYEDLIQDGDILYVALFHPFSGRHRRCCSID